MNILGIVHPSGAFFNPALFQIRVRSFSKRDYEIIKREIEKTGVSNLAKL